MHQITNGCCILFGRRSNNYGGGGGFNVWVSPTDFFFFTVCSFCIASKLYRQYATVLHSLRALLALSELMRPPVHVVHHILRVQDPYYMRRRRYAYGYQGNALQQPEPKMNFFQAIFSFVFGDGDPNLDWEERRWQTVRLSPQEIVKPLLEHQSLDSWHCRGE
jgi:hypothetical protein